jgi:general stress protein 26
MNDDLTKLYEHIDDIEIAMMTTRRSDGHLVSRAMATQKRAAGADLWFVTCDDSAKVREIQGDPHVNLSYYKDRTSEWVSVSGIATFSRDRGKIKELWSPHWELYFQKQGDPRDGTPDDPRMLLIGVTVHAAVFLEVNKPRPVVIYEMVKGWITGTQPDIGEMHRVGGGTASR